MFNKNVLVIIIVSIVKWLRVVITSRQEGLCRVWREERLRIAAVRLGCSLPHHLCLPPSFVAEEKK